jgi:glycosyltransferase involved in cell wall biosynthesis
LTDGVLVLSTEEARAFVACEPHAKVQAVTNPFAVETEAPSRRRGTGPPLVLFAGRLLWEKGVLDTIEAFALLRKRMDVRLLIAGDGPAAEDVRGAVARHGLVDDVRVAGRLDRARLDRVYREAAAFVLPTYHPEGFPTALSEAMSAGLPIVTTASRGSADHLIDGTNALFVPPRDPSALADALERVLTDRALAARMSEANLAKVEEFAPERVAPAYVAALSEMRS